MNITYIFIVINYLCVRTNCLLVDSQRKQAQEVLSLLTCTKHAIISLPLIKMVVVVVVFILVTSGDDGGGGDNGGCAF